MLWLIDYILDITICWMPLTATLTIISFILDQYIVLLYNNYDATRPLSNMSKTTKLHSLVIQVSACQVNFSSLTK